MRELHAQNNLPWVTIGDFNEILYSHEKEGGNTHPQHFMQAFHDAMNDCNLEDIGFSGDPFTWCRGRIREHLDRALASNTWITMHPEASL
jgi:endonuclease/exonuclease/phosphatase family metal-dependent hydrolase